jgi:hypothetical protein
MTVTVIDVKHLTRILMYHFLVPATLRSAENHFNASEMEVHSHAG